MPASVQLPLEGIRVVELGNHVAGPYAATLLGDFGADVIKVEPPPGRSSSHVLSGFETGDSDRSLFHLTIARNKRSLAMDIQVEEGREVLLRLIASADVLVENFRPGTLERWDLGFSVLARHNPHLVVLRVSGFGQEGPRGQEPGVDRVAQAFAGAVSLTGFPDQHPVRCGLAIADYSAGLMGALGVLLALRTRDRDRNSGPTAQVIDQSLFDALLPMLGELPELYRRHGEVRERTGNRHPGTAPGNTYQGSDGTWLIASVPGDAIFARLANLVGHPEWIADPANRDPVARDANAALLEAGVAAWVAACPGAEAARQMSEAGVPSNRVNTVADVVDDDLVRYRHSFTTYTDERLGEVMMAAPAPRLGRTPGSIRRSAPWPGRDSLAILSELGLEEDAVARLRDEGVVSTPA